MAFGYSGSNNASQSKKSRKDSAKGSSASVHSHSSQSTGRSLNPFAKKEVTPATTPSRSRTQSTSSTTKSPVANKSPAKPADTDKKSKDVFEFLEEEEDDDSEESGSEETSSGSETDEDAVDEQPKSTPFTPATIGLQLARGPPVLQPGASFNEASVQKKDVPSPAQEKKELDFSAMPETLYTQRNPTPLQRPFPPSPPKSPEETHSKKVPKMRKTHNAKPKKIASGYGYLAPRIKVSKGDGGKDRLPPLYRQFEHLNHRVLLHLQDEIAMMEEDLHTLDELEEGYRAAEREKSKAQPASRRLEAQAQSTSTLHARRQNLMELLIQKTEQYNNALFSYTRVIQTLPRATEPDIKTYRTWMKDRKPIASAETRFLDHDQDLVSISPYLPSSSIAGGPSKPSSPSIFPAIVIASTAILLPLLAFSMVSEFTGRLVLVAIVGGAASVVAGHYSTGTDQLVDPRDGWRCAMGYFGFMTMAAMFIP